MLKGFVLVLFFPSAVWALTNVHSYSVPQEDLIRYHGDHVCDRAGYNTFKERMARYLTYQKYKGTVGFDAVPNQRTVLCPEVVQDLSTPGNNYGYDTVWIVENTASDPVVLSYVNPIDGVEYSAMNTKITPPHDDPDAILAPGLWRAIYSWEGHVFLARQLLTKGSSEKALGPVLMQHRTGLIPIGLNAQELMCMSSDPEPLLNGTRVPEYARTPPATDRLCNTIDLGFRNMANCPLHAYYVNPMGDEQVQALADYEEVDDTKPLYEELFEFHLGINPRPLDFTWDWDSKTKFEGTMIGHTFAFRSAEDPSILVETHTVRPTRIPDCPNLKKKQQVNRVTSIGIAQAVVLPTGPQELSNATSFYSKAWNLNATRSNRPHLIVTADEAMVSAVLAS